MTSKRELQFRLDASRSIVREYEKALRKAAGHLNYPVSYFGEYSLENFVSDLETVANEKTATEARKRLGLDKPEDTEMSKVEKELREIAYRPGSLPKVPEYDKDLGINYSVFKGNLDALTKRVADLEADMARISRVSVSIREDAKVTPINKNSSPSYAKGGYIKKPKPRYRLEAIPCTKPQEYTVVPIEEK